MSAPQRVIVLIGAVVQSTYDVAVDGAHEIWDLIERSNTAWLSGRPADTAELFAADARLVAPGLVAVVDGRDAIVQTYAETVATTTTDRFEVTDRLLSVTDDVAVATYVYDVVYRSADGQHHERGQEVLVMRDNGDAWQVIWRTQIPLPRDVAPE